MTGVIAVLAGARGNPYIGSAVVTVGKQVLSNSTNYGYNGGGSGSISPSTWGSTGFTFSYLNFTDYTVSPTNTWIELFVAGYAPNSGWDTMTIAGTVLNRSSAAIYTTNGSTYTSWVWSPATNLFGTTIGATKAVTWA